MDVDEQCGKWFMKGNAEKNEHQWESKKYNNQIPNSWKKKKASGKGDKIAGGDTPRESTWRQGE